MAADVPPGGRSYVQTRFLATEDSSTLTTLVVCRVSELTSQVKSSHHACATLYIINIVIERARGVAEPPTPTRSKWAARRTASPARWCSSAACSGCMAQPGARQSFAASSRRLLNALRGGAFQQHHFVHGSSSWSKCCIGTQCTRQSRRTTSLFTRSLRSVAFFGSCPGIDNALACSWSTLGTSCQHSQRI